MEISERPVDGDLKSMEYQNEHIIYLHLSPQPDVLGNNSHQPEPANDGGMVLKPGV